MSGREGIGWPWWTAALLLLLWSPVIAVLALICLLVAHYGR